MPRPKKVDRPVELAISLPSSLATRMELELYSELEGRVPHGARSRFLAGLIEQHFAKIDASASFASKAAKTALEGLE